MCSILSFQRKGNMKTRSSWDFHRGLSVMCFVVRFLVRCAAKWDPKDFTTKPPLPSQMMLMWIWDSLKNGPWISIGLKFNVSILNRLLFRIRVFSHSWEFPRLNQCSTQINNALSHASLVQTPQKNCPGRSHWSLEVDGVEVDTLWEEIRAILGMAKKDRSLTNGYQKWWFGKGSSFMFDIYINYINDLRGVPHLIKGFLRG